MTKDGLTQTQSAEEAAVVGSLRDAGVAVSHIQDVHRGKFEYKIVRPILVGWLPRLQTIEVKDQVVRALSVPQARSDEAARVLVGEFESVESRTSYRWDVANALSVIATDTVRDDLLRIAGEKQWGKDREMIVLALANLPGPRTVSILMDLIDDDDVRGHAVMALGRLRAVEARSRVQAVLSDKRPWVRSEARKALKRMSSPEQPERRRPREHA